MTIQLAVDRFEGRRKEIAVLVSDDGRQIDFPRNLLPKGTKGGDLLNFTIERDVEATRKLVEETRAIQNRLKQRDPGGDLKL